MAERHPSITSGSFYKRGDKYSYYGFIDGQRSRLATGQDTLEAAVNWVSTNFPLVRAPRITGSPSDQLLRRVLSWTKRRAREYGLQFALTMEDVQVMLRRGRGRCEVSGLRFSEVKVAGARRRPFVPSIDRIDRARGYTPGNCRLVCASVNLAMNDFGEGILRLISAGVVGRRRRTSATSYATIGVADLSVSPMNTGG